MRSPFSQEELDTMSPKVYKLAKEGCSKATIGAILGIDPCSVSNRFKSEYKKGRAELQHKIIRQQIYVAFNTSPGNENNALKALLHLGKHIAEQNDLLYLNVEPTDSSLNEVSDQELIEIFTTHQPKLKVVE